MQLATSLRLGLSEDRDQRDREKEMGNAVTRCCVGAAVVRIMRPNGRIDDFDFPVTASEVMQRYPHHLVIHSNYIERDCSLEQQRRKVTIMRPENRLVSGHEYILYPIPPQFREVVARTFAKQWSSLKPEEEHHPKQQQQQLKRKVGRRTQIIAATRQHLATILQTPRDSSKVGDEDRETGEMLARKRMDSLESFGNVVCGEVGVNIDDDDDDEGFSFYYGASWKPSLQSICESPSLPDPAHVRRHSFSALPLEIC